MTPLTCFKAYDIRGRLGIDLDEDIAYRIGRAFAVALEARSVVLGRDVRSSSESLAESVARGLMDAGCAVLDLGLSGTEEMYFATTHFGFFTIRAILFTPDRLAQAPRTKQGDFLLTRLGPDCNDPSTPGPALRYASRTTLPTR